MYHTGIRQQMLRMSDGSSLRVWQLLSEKHPSELAILLLGGWGGTIAPSDRLPKELQANFDVVLVEPRESSSSVLVENIRHDLSRCARDYAEICDQLALDPQRLIVFAYSWSSVVLAQAVSKHGWRPNRVVLGCPVRKLTLPPLLRYMIPVMPIAALNSLRPLAGWWITHFKARDRADARKAQDVIAAADLGKWQKVARNVVTKSFDRLYADLDVPVVAVRALDERFHGAEEHRRIVTLVPDCRDVELPVGADEFDLQVAQIIRDVASQALNP